MACRRGRKVRVVALTVLQEVPLQSLQSGDRMARLSACLPVRKMLW